MDSTINRELINTLNVLNANGTLLYPSDTIWGIGCDATNPEAVSKIYKLKQRIESKALICLVNGYKMLEDYVEIVPQKAIKIISEATKPTTIIYNNPRLFAKNLLAEDGSIAIRMTTSGFAHELITQFNKPIVSTSANISGEPSPKSFKEISDGILKGVDYVVNLPDIKTDTRPSTIIKLNEDGTVQIIRE